MKKLFSTERDVEITEIVNVPYEITEDAPDPDNPEQMISVTRIEMKPEERKRIERRRVTETVDMTPEEIAVFEAERTAPPSADKFKTSVEAYTNRVAAERGFASAIEAMAYKSSGVAAWGAEAEAFTLWNDAVWIATYAVLDAGPLPSVEKHIESLPKIAWPEGV